MRKIKRVIAIILTALILLSTIPMTIFATDSNAAPETKINIDENDPIFTIALADMYSGRNNGIGWDNYLHYISNFEGPYRTMSDSLKNDEKHKNAVATWDFINGLGSSYEFIKNSPEYYYETVILDMLQKSAYKGGAASTFSEDALAYTATVGTHLAESLKIDCEDLAKTSSDGIDKILLEGMADLYQVDLDTISQIQDTVSVVSTAADFAEKLGAYIAVRKAAGSMMDVLRMMSNATSNRAMKIALNDIVTACGGDLEDFCLQVALETDLEIVGNILAGFADWVIGKVTGSWGIDIGITFGQMVSNALFSTQETITQYKNMCVIVEFENLLRTVAKNCNSAYKNSPTLDNANDVIEAANMVFHVVNYGMELSHGYAQIVLKDNLWTHVCSWVGINKNKESLSKWNESWESLKKQIDMSMEFYHKEYVISWAENYWDEDYANFFDDGYDDSGEVEEPETKPVLIVAKEIKIQPDGTVEKGTVYDNGDGSQYAPHRIRTQEDLQKYTVNSSGKYYKLMNDISVSSANWAPIANFGGYFEGNDHVIDGITISQSGSSNNLGLFANISGGTVRHLGVTNVKITANTTGSVGAIAGENRGTIEYCYSTGNITNDLNGKIGGLVGNNYHYGFVSDCYSTVNITANGNSASVGGVIGNNYYNTSTSYGKVKRCYAVGKITTPSGNSGGVVGTGSTGVKFAYYDKMTTRCGDLGKGYSVTTAELKTPATFSGWDFENVWAVNSFVNNGYPYLRPNAKRAAVDMDGAGTSTNPYIITNERQLVAIEDEEYPKNAYYVLNNDITITAPYWTPIRDFSGNFNGQGHKIDGLTITQDPIGNIGLFARNSGTIRYLGVTNFKSTVSTNSNVGALAGENRGIIEYCYSTGNITNDSNGYIGGLVGNNYHYGLVSDCYSTVNITANGNSASVGGVIGNNYYNTSTSYGKVKRCYAVGKITTPSGNSGGVVGTGSTGVKFSYYDKMTTRCGDLGKGYGVTTAEMKNISTFNGWDFSKVWAVDSNINNGYPYLRQNADRTSVEMDGAGTSTNPYVITNERQLVAIEDEEYPKNAYYVLANDITITAPYWTPIRDFSGNFNGQGHKIDGLTITQDPIGNIGLFARNSGTIRYLGVTNFKSTVSTNSNVGALAGENRGIIEYCYSTGNITNDSNGYIGGLVGNNYHYGLVSDCYSTVNITANGNSASVGGVIGNNYYNTSTSYGKVKRCYAVGKITTPSGNSGGVVGTGSAGVKFSYYDKMTTRCGDLGKGYSVTTTELKTPATFSGWDFDNVWAVNSSVNNGYPYLRPNAERVAVDMDGAGTSTNPYIITNERQLVAIEDGEYPKDKYYVLANDITIIAPYWTPISDFSGNFNGQGHKIDGLTITQDPIGNIGLFARNSGTIRYLGVTNFKSTVSTNSNVGALAGENRGIIEYCYSTGNITNDSNGYIGGLVGNNYHYGLVSDCYSTANITANGNSASVGGVIGNNYYNTSTSYGKVKRCYAVGKITTPSGNYGGVVGTGSAGVKFSYYDKMTTRCGDLGKGYSVTTTELKNPVTFSGWDFENVWAVNSSVNNGYPYLRPNAKRAAVDMDGAGTSTNPYIITNERQLVAIVDGEYPNDKYYVLNNDITITAPYWTPIYFKGNFNGLGHKIDGLTITQDPKTNIGLFSNNEGIIRYLGVTNFRSTVSEYAVGALAGGNSGKIEYCYATGSIDNSSTDTSYNGGLVGANDRYGEIHDCYTDVDITVYGVNPRAGGVVGTNNLYAYSSGAFVKRCYATGKITSSAQYTGGIVGENNKYGVIDNCFYDTNTTGKSDTDKGTPLTTAQMKNAANFTGWDFDTVWGQSGYINSGYPYLRDFDYEDTAPVTLTSIEVVELPNKVVYEVGETFDSTGMKVKLNYSDGSAEYITSGFVCDVKKFDTVGTRSLTVGYKGKTTALQVKVIEKTTDEIASGLCGSTSRWVLKKDGTLIISGTGIVKHYAKPAAVPWNKYAEQIKSVVVEDGITRIGEFAFYGCANLTSVKIANSVKEISGYVFKKCSSIESIILPAALQKIGDSAFYGCSSLKKVVIPRTVSNIGYYAFAHCLALNEVEFLGSAPAFCTNIFKNVTATVYYPANDISWTSGNMLSYGGDLTWIKRNTGSADVIDSGYCGTNVTWTLTSDGTLTFGGTGKMKNYDTAGQAPWNKYLNSITKIVVEDGITYIGSFTFYGFDRVVSVVLPESVTTIGAYAFKNCTGLRMIILPNGLTTIGESAFYGCNNLLVAVIPESVTSIGAYAFSRCSSIRAVEFLGNAPAIGMSAFSKVTATVYYPMSDLTWTASKTQNYGGVLTWVGK